MKTTNNTIKKISESKQPFIIAETAYNHEGDKEYMYSMIDSLSGTDIDSVKFHLLLNPASYMQKNHALINQLSQWIFSKNEWKEIIEYSLKRNLKVVALCDDIESIIFVLNEFPELFAIEIHATSLNDYFILKEAAKFNGNIILGIGGSTIDEIQYALNFLNPHNPSKMLLMYGFQNYPTKYEKVNLAKMFKISKLFELPVGYADHTAFDDPNNVYISSLPAAMGINILEKHFTLDVGKDRIDYHASVSVEDIVRIKNKMKIGLNVLGDGDLNLNEDELEYGNNGPMKKAIVAKRNLVKGEIITHDNIWFKRTIEETYMKQNMLSGLIGTEVIQDIFEDEIIDFSKVKYKFNKLNLSNFTNLNK